MSYGNESEVLNAEVGTAKPDCAESLKNLDKPDKPYPTDDKPLQRAVEILVNEHPVKVVDCRQTGREIKEAAICAGVKIELDFVLSVEYEPSHRKIVGDTDVIEVKEGMRFVAIADDDNS